MVTLEIPDDFTSMSTCFLNLIDIPRDRPEIVEILT